MLQNTVPIKANTIAQDNYENYSDLNANLHNTVQIKATFKRLVTL